jgi:hypothetical protein
MARPAYQDRIDNPENYPVIRNDDGTVSTHRMATMEQDGVHYAFPMIAQLEDGSLHEFQNPADALRYNRMFNNVKAFDDHKTADEYARNYKQGTALDELGRITQNYALGTEDLFRDYFGDSGTTSHYVSEPAIPYQHPEYQEERMDPDRIALAVREGAGKIPGDIAELAELIRPVLQYAPGGAPLRTAPVKRFMEDLPESADRYWMSNPNYFDESRSVKPLSFDENVAGWGTRIAADPLNIVAGAIPKSGILATKVMMPKGTQQIDEIRHMLVNALAY